MPARKYEALLAIDHAGVLADPSKAACRSALLHVMLSTNRSASNGSGCCAFIQPSGCSRSPTRRDNPVRAHKLAT